MTTAILPAPAIAHSKLSAAGIVRSEWIKLRTVRSTLWCFGVIILLIVGSVF